MTIHICIVWAGCASATCRAMNVYIAFIGRRGLSIFNFNINKIKTMI